MHAGRIGWVSGDRKSVAVYERLQVVGVSELGRNLREARENAGVSLSAMARRTHYSRALLGHLETGVRVIKPEHVTVYSHALNVAASALYDRPDDPLRVAHEWLVSDTPAARHQMAGRRVGESLAAELENRVVELRHLDDVLGGGDLYPLVHRELAAAQQVLDETSYSTEVGARLSVVVGELAQLDGWVASDAGHYAQAQASYLDGVSAAHQAGDHALVGQLLSSLSYQIANVGNPTDAELLARTAVKGANDAPPIVRALLLERVAWASARARNSEGARRALDAVDDAYEHRRGLPEPEWTYWLDRSEIEVMAGRVYIELGQPTDAEPLLSKAINGYDSERTREVALYRTWLAEAFANAGELDAARATIRKAERAASTINSARLDRRVSEIARLRTQLMNRVWLFA